MPVQRLHGHGGYNRNTLVRSIHVIIRRTDQRGPLWSDYPLLSYYTSVEARASGVRTARTVCLARRPDGQQSGPAGHII